VIEVALVSAVDRLLQSLPVVRIGEDPEGVHKSRVAIRRLRSHLRSFGPLLDRDWANGLRAELSSLADDLGSVRDADVLGSRLRSLMDRHPEIGHGAGSEVTNALDRQRSRDRAALVMRLDDASTAELLDRLVAEAASPRTNIWANEPAREQLLPLVSRRRRRLTRVVEGLDHTPTVDDLHRVRIQAKRARYAAEAVAPVFGIEAVRFADAAADLQDVLGDLNDAVVASTWLDRVAPLLSNEAAFAAGQLSQQLRIDSIQQVDNWRKPYRKLRKRSAWLN
jgi:CHAD domain-containing protein